MAESPEPLAGYNGLYQQLLVSSLPDAAKHIVLMFNLTNQNATRSIHRLRPGPPARRTLRRTLAVLTGSKGGAMTRPAWVNDELFPFQSRFLDVNGAQVHYIDEGDGPVFLALHGNPTWSFLYRHIVAGLQDRFRCVAVDYPGFGLSTAPAGYRYTIAEHARVVEAFVDELGLRDITVMVQDWGGPIGFWVATHHPEWFRAFVIGNTWAWPIHDLNTRLFSTTLGSRALGGLLVKRADIFANLFMRGGIRRRKLSPAERDMYRKPHPTPASREPVHVMPREILTAHELLADVEQGLGRVADKPALIVWGDKDPAFKATHRSRWERTFPNHRTQILRGASHYIQEDAPDEIIAAITDWWPTLKPGD